MYTSWIIWNVLSELTRATQLCYTPGTLDIKMIKRWPVVSESLQILRL